MDPIDSDARRAGLQPDGAAQGLVVVQGRQAEAVKSEPAKAARAQGLRRRWPSRRSEAELSPAAAALRDTHGIGEGEARILAADEVLRAFFDQAVATGAGAKAVANWSGERRAPRAEGRGREGATVRRRGARRAVRAHRGRDDLGEDREGGLRRDGEDRRAPQGHRGAARDRADRRRRRRSRPRSRRWWTRTRRWPRATGRGTSACSAPSWASSMKKTGGKASPKLVNELLKQKLERRTGRSRFGGPARRPPRHRPRSLSLSIPQNPARRPRLLRGRPRISRREPRRRAARDPRS